MSEEVTRSVLHFRYELIDGPIPGPAREPLWLLYASIFTDKTSGNFWPEIDEQAARDLLTLLAWADDELVGFKMGYMRKPGHFYSWLGGVRADFRGHGIASELMRRQHDWCQQNGFRAVRTHTRNQWRDMLILNLRHGFDIIGTFLNEEGTVNIMLEKQFSRPDSAVIGP